VSATDPHPRLNRRSERTTGGRPLGVTIICLLGILGFLVAWIPILGLAAGTSTTFLLALGLSVLNIASLAVLVGLWMMRRWAWILAILFYSLTAVADLLAVNVLGLFISVLIVVYRRSRARTPTLEVGGEARRRTTHVHFG